MALAALLHTRTHARPCSFLHAVSVGSGDGLLSSSPSGGDTVHYCRDLHCLPRASRGRGDPEPSLSMSARGGGTVHPLNCRFRSRRLKAPLSCRAETPGRSLFVPFPSVNAPSLAKLLVKKREKQMPNVAVNFKILPVKLCPPPPVG